MTRFGRGVMAKDDYHVVVFRILKYLYQRLKKGRACRAGDAFVRQQGLSGQRKLLALHLDQHAGRGADQRSEKGERTGRL